MGWFPALLLSLVYAAILLAAGFVVGGWAAGLVRWWLERARVDPEVRQLAVSVVRPLVLLLAVIAAVESLGVDLSGLVAIVAVVALTVGLATYGTLANGAAGGLLFTVRPFRVGDVVELAGERGTVVDLQWFVTTIRTADGVLVTVPNRLLVDRPIRNLTRNGALRVEVPVRLPADVDPERARDAIRGALTGLPRLLPEPAPDVALAAEGDRVVVTAWTRAEDAAAAGTDVLAAARAAVREPVARDVARVPPSPA